MSPWSSSSASCLPQPIRGHFSPAGEWTLDQARHRGQAMVRPVQHVGLPGCQFQAGVMWNGALLLGPLESRDVKVISKN